MQCYQAVFLVVQFFATTVVESRLELTGQSLVNVGETVTLTCQTGGTRDQLQSHLVWYFGEDNDHTYMKIYTNGSRWDNRVTITPTVKHNPFYPGYYYLISVLHIRRSSVDDTGGYECRSEKSRVMKNVIVLYDTELKLTGQPIVYYQETMILTCTNNNPWENQLVWHFRQDKVEKEIDPNKEPWKFRTTITTATSPDNVTSSVLQVANISFGDTGGYACRSGVLTKRKDITVFYALKITGKSVVNFQETLILTCTDRNSMDYPLAWTFRQGNVHEEIDPDKTRWMFRTTITTTTRPDNVASSVLQIKYSSIGDTGSFECVSGPLTTIHNVTVLYETCLDDDEIESIFVPGKGCVYVGSQYPSYIHCEPIMITDWKDQLVTSDLAKKYVEHHGYANGDYTQFPIHLKTHQRGFYWKHFIRGSSERLTYTAWEKFHTFVNEDNLCVAITIKQGNSPFKNWKLSSCDLHQYTCQNSTGIKKEARHLPTRIPDTTGSITVDPSVLDRLFQCQKGEYIFLEHVCDYRPNCMDQSDESSCKESKRAASMETFFCENGEPLSMNLVCDFYPNCYDGSDERDCYKPPCLSGQWRCNSGQCIADYDVCDSEEECRDGSDEWSVICYDRNPIDTVWPCFTSRNVPKLRICDDFEDCGKGKDEDNHICFARQTMFPRYSCSNVFPERYGLYQKNMVNVNFGTGSYETVTCSELSKFALITWPFSASADTLDRDEFCGFEYGKDRYVHIRLLFDKLTAIHYKSEHLLTILTSRLKNCTQKIQLCSDTDTFGAFNFIEFASDLEGRRLRKLPVCGNVRLHSRDKDRIHPSCHNQTTILTGEDVPIRWINLKDIDFEGSILCISPPSCREDEAFVDPKYFEPQLHCQNRMSYYPHQKCLMEFDVTGEPIPCRDLTHLQNCETYPCPENYMKCPNSYCVPARLLCDGIPHCPHSEDEQHCDTFTCPGYFRCNTNTTCIPLEQVCDGIAHCPRADDERHCDVVCPDGCSCKGLIFRCVDNNVNQYRVLSELLPSTTRALDMQTNLSNWTGYISLQFPAMLYLSMQNCHIGTISIFRDSDLRSLLTLDLSYNEIEILEAESFMTFSTLKYLVLNQNPIITIEDKAFAGLRLLEELTLIGSKVRSLFPGIFVECGALVFVNLSSNQIQTIADDAFNNLAYVKTLDLRDNQVQLTENLFNGLSSLTVLYVDSYTLCCAKPDSVTDQNCFAPRDSISSCTDLIRLTILRVALWIIGLCAIFGNMLVLVYRFKYDRVNLRKSYSIFVISLSLSDILMGVYMIIIGVADAVYRGRYVWEEMGWRHSTICTVSGILSTVSSEASAFAILFISIDRMVAIAFPFSLRQFTMKSALVISCFIWTVSIMIAILPIVLFQDYFQGLFYSSSGVCLALPLSDSANPGSEFSVAIFVGLNFVIFLVIAICQVVIYKKSKTSQSLRKTTKKQARDIAVARTLTAVVTTDFLCWFPIGVLGIWTSFGGSLSGDVYAWIMVFVLPINSALNPFLYTFTTMRQQKKKKTSGNMDMKSETEMTKVVLGVLKKFRQKQRDMPLVEYLNNPQTNLYVRDAFDIVLRLSESLAYLHQQDLVHGNISHEFVEVDVRKDRVRRAVFSMDHDVTRDSEQFKDIQAFGVLVKTLLKKVKLP